MFWIYGVFPLNSTGTTRTYDKPTSALGWLNMADERLDVLRSGNIMRRPGHELSLFCRKNIPSLQTDVFTE